MSERVEPEEMIAWIDRRLASAGNWLNTFSDGPKKRPDIEIQTKQYDIARFNEIRTAYVKAWERKKAAEENEQGGSVSTVA